MRCDAEAGALPPVVGERINLPAKFGRRFIIMADAEEEFDWAKPLARANVATTAIRSLPSATARFNACGVWPSYLLDYPVVDNPESGAIIRDLVKADLCDFGTQLHPWVNPPFEEEVVDRNSFTKNLSAKLQRQKLLALTERIEAVVGARPIVHRAGRYGVGRELISILRDAGYRMDVSVRSRWTYDASGGPDFLDHPLWPWRIDDQMIELPLSTAWTGALRRKPNTILYKLFPGTLARTRLLQRVPLTPEGIPLSSAIEAIKALDEEDVRIFSLSFHTPSLAIGHTPYVTSQAELDTFWAWWDGVFNQFAKMGIEPVRQGEIIAAAKQAD